LTLNQNHFMSRIFLIDTDTASDDALALIMAMRAQDVRIAAITTVSGNVSVEQATLNALYVEELCRQEIPVYRGAAKPLRRPNVHSYWFHGKDGLGDHDFKPVRRTADGDDAIDRIIDTILSNPGLTVVALGPLTNIANAITRNPKVIAKVGRCVVMGGAPCGGGNVTPAAEYNFWTDPEAAMTVICSGLPVELVGLHLSRGEAALSASDVRRIENLSNSLSRFAIACTSCARPVYLKQTGEDGMSLADPVAMSIALDPSVVRQASEHYVSVETKSELTRGFTAVDLHDIAGDERNRRVWRASLESGVKVKVCWKIDPGRWKQMLIDALNRPL
jgi:purine nucleosidase